MLGRWGGGWGGGGEFPLPQTLIFYFSNFRVTRHFCPIILLHSSLFPVSFALLFIIFPLHFILWPFYCFCCCCCCCCFISYFFLFAANFSVFLLISALEQRGGGFLGVEGRGKGGGGIRLITSHTERTKFFIAWKKAASFRDTLVRRKSLGWWDLSFQNFFTKGMF